MDDADKVVPREWNTPRGKRKSMAVKSKIKVHALRPQIGCDKGNAVRVLLADNAHGRPDDNQSVLGMSGIDIYGPFLKAASKVKFLIVAIDYFKKWIEAKPDNGKQFRDDPFKTWCEKLNITQNFASVKHLQSNRLVERANRSLGEGIKARLGKDNKDWVEELPMSYGPTKPRTPTELGPPRGEERAGSHS
ncbi:reverse transcriptase domain-containing protein [Tanacetum coccineum]